MILCLVSCSPMLVTAYPEVLQVLRTCCNTVICDQRCGGLYFKLEWFWFLSPSLRRLGVSSSGVSALGGLLCPPQSHIPVNSPLLNLAFSFIINVPYHLQTCLQFILYYNSFIFTKMWICSFILVLVDIWVIRFVKKHHCAEHSLTCACIRDMCKCLSKCSGLELLGHRVWLKAKFFSGGSSHWCLGLKELCDFLWKL